MSHYVLVPLGRGYSPDYSGICPAAQARCRQALNEAQRLIAAGDSATILVAPGTETWRRTGPTMAALMGDHLAQLGQGIELIVNRDKLAVYGSLQEMRWAVEIAQQRYGSNLRLMFVCAKRQDIRLRLIARVWFKGTAIQVITTDDPEDPPLPLWYEVVLAYPKLLAVWLGFGIVAEAFRRCVTLPIRR